MTPMTEAIQSSHAPDVTRVPQVTFKTRVRNDALGGPNPFEWCDLTSDDVFKGKRVVVFALPGAFTPTCSTSHLPRYEELYGAITAQGVDAVVCISVNDAFVMYQWGRSQNAERVFLLPDGNGDFAAGMGMLVDKENLGFGKRSLALCHGRRRRRDREDVRRAGLRRQPSRRSVRGLRRRHGARLPQEPLIVDW